MLSLEFSVEEGDGGYRVNYTVGARVAQVTGQQTGKAGTTKSFEFHSLTQSGAALVKDGQTVALSVIEGKALKLSVKKAE